MRILAAFLFLVFQPGFLSASFAQQADSVGMRSTSQQSNQKRAVTDSLWADTVATVKKERQLIPKKSGLYSALIPGMGQLYNRQYWKMPIIYAACGAAIYFFIDNRNNYNSFRKEIAGRASGDPNFVSKYPEYPDPQQLIAARDYYRRNLDLTGLLTALGYTLQVMDAVVSGHLKGFDISPDISMQMRPVIVPQGGVGMGLVFNLK